MKINYALVQLMLLMLVIGYAVALMCGVSVPEANKAEFAAVFAVILTLLNVDKLKESISKATDAPPEQKAPPADAGFARLSALLALLLMLAACAPLISNVVQQGCAEGPSKLSQTNKADSDQAPSTSATTPIAVGVGGGTASPTGTSNLGAAPTAAVKCQGCHGERVL